MSEFQHSVGFTAAILNRFLCKDVRMFMACKFSFCNILEKAKCGSLGRNHHHWSTIKNPSFKGMYHRRPPDFYWRPQSFHRKLPDFYWRSINFHLRPQIFTRVSSYWSNRLQMFKPQTFCRTPQSFHWRPQTFSYEPQFCFMGNTLIFSGDLKLCKSENLRLKQKVWCLKWTTCGFCTKHLGLWWKVWGLQRKV